jgi:hypothetical protein
MQGGPSDAKRCAWLPAVCPTIVGTMLGPTRPLPQMGAPARIKHFGGSNERGTVVAVRDGGTRLSVEGQDGELYEFVLSPANARFVSAGDAHGPRLELLGAG